MFFIGTLVSFEVVTVIEGRESFMSNSILFHGMIIGSVQQLKDYNSLFPMICLRELDRDFWVVAYDGFGVGRAGGIFHVGVFPLKI